MMKVAFGNSIAEYQAAAILRDRTAPKQVAGNRVPAVRSDARKTVVPSTPSPVVTMNRLNLFA